MSYFGQQAAFLSVAALVVIRRFQRLFVRPDIKERETEKETVLPEDINDLDNLGKCFLSFVLGVLYPVLYPVLLLAGSSHCDIMFCRPSSGSARSTSLSFK